MSFITQEIAVYRAEFEALVASWNALARSERRKEWERYTRLLDHGEAGEHRFSLLLINAWCEGWDAVSGIAYGVDGLLISASELGGSS